MLTVMIRGLARPREDTSLEYESPLYPLSPRRPYRYAQNIRAIARYIIPENSTSICVDWLDEV